MDRKEVTRLLGYIESSYLGKLKTNFDTPTEKIVDTWLFYLKGQSFDDTRERLRRYILDGNKFPPSVADMVIPPTPEMYTKKWKEKMEQWEREAGPPPDDLELPEFVKEKGLEEKIRRNYEEMREQKKREGKANG